MSNPHNCLWCCWCVHIDGDDFYCDELDIHKTRAQASARNGCQHYGETDWRADDLEMMGVKPEPSKEELEKYNKRMAGDWS